MLSLTRLIVVAAAMAVPVVAAAQIDPRPRPGAVAPLLTTPEAVDGLSFAKPREARVTHVDLDLAVDFADHSLSGTAGLDILAAPGAKTVVLDTDKLVISKITDGEGRPLPYKVGAPGEEGAPLTVTLNGARRVLVTYKTGPDPKALQWLEPQLTAGKIKPLLYSQGQSRNNRSWIPTQDSPGIRQSWTARIIVPADMTAVMSGDKLTPQGEEAGPGRRAFRFRMTHATAPYLIAIAVGDIAFKPLGARTGVYTEPSMMDRAAAELTDTEKMVETAERLYGPYRWGRYDVLVLPPAFPFGGMENTTLSFLTPTFITGDKANVSLVAHELAHSWSGNLVTNATWKDIWLNEGFTSYVENRIVEELYGVENARVAADLQWDELVEGQKSGTAESNTLYGENTDVQYTRGAAFLRTLEHIVGRERWDAYLRGYFDRHAFAPQTTAGFLADLREHLIKGDTALEQRMMLDDWIYTPAIPTNAYHEPSQALPAVDKSVAAFVGGAHAADLPFKGWSTQEWQRFLQNLPRKLTTAQMADLDSAMALSASTNAYVRAAWLKLVIANHYDPALPSLEAFLGAVGRGLFVNPLYTGLMGEGDWGKPLAKRYFEAFKGSYHPTVRARNARVVAG